MLGREEEKRVLLSLLESDKSEFVAIYGRRRVGKTYLVRETFNYKFAFQHTGLQEGTIREQLEEFANSLITFIVLVVIQYVSASVFLRNAFTY